MKAIRRLLGSAVALSAVFLFSAANAAAQNPCDDAESIAALDAKIRTNFPKEDTLEIALEAAKQYVQKFGECEPKDLAVWLKDRIGKWEQTVKDVKDREKIKKFDDAVKNRKYDEVYSVGKELVQRFPDNVHFLLPLALIGLPETYKNNFKYNDDTIKYAKLALARLKSGSAEPKKDSEGKVKTDANGKPLFGVFQFERNAEDAISEMTYALGYILYNAKKDKRAGLLYYYETSQLPGFFKTEPRIYASIGQYYMEESAPIAKEIAGLIQKQNAAATDEEKQKIEAEIKPKAALLNGYNQRAADAFSRAYRFYDEGVPAEKVAKSRLVGILAELLPGEGKDLDQRSAGLIKEPFPDPASQVTPIEEPEPAKTPAAEKTPNTRPAPGKAKPAPARKRRP